MHAQETALAYLAHDLELDREIAVKLLPPHLADDDEHLARLRQEARTASSLNHPNIVTIYEIGQHEGSADAAGRAEIRERIQSTVSQMEVGEKRDRVAASLDRLR